MAFFPVSVVRRPARCFRSCGRTTRISSRCRSIPTPPVVSSRRPAGRTLTATACSIAAVARMVIDQLGRIGAAAVPRVFESGAFIARHETHDFDAFVGSWRESTKVDLKSNFHSAARDGGYNYGRYTDPELDRLIDRARAESDPRAARSLWIAAQ